MHMWKIASSTGLYLNHLFQLASRASKIEKLSVQIETYQPENRNESKKLVIFKFLSF